MALSYKSRRRLSLLALVIGLPLYIVAAVTIVAQFDRPHPVLELGVYIGLGILWAVALKPVFMGVGKADPDAPTDQD